MKRSTVLAQRAFPWRLFAVRTCTGVAAVWCPVHGTCACSRCDDGDFPHGMNDPDCPLHGASSTHPNGVVSLSEVADPPEAT